MSSSTRCTRRRPVRSSSNSKTNRLNAYLAAGLGAATGLTASVDAGIIDIDIGPSGFNIGGVNGGVAAGVQSPKTNFPASGQGTLVLMNRAELAGYTYTGLSALNLRFATAGSVASPVKFAENALIDGSANWTQSQTYSVFYYRYNTTVTSPDFGANSYMGFRTASGNFGWLEVTWSSATKNFEILSGAYESVPGVAIGAGVQAVPEPSTLALGGVGALVCGGAALRRLRKQKRA